MFNPNTDVNQTVFQIGKASLENDYKKLPTCVKENSAARLAKHHETTVVVLADDKKEEPGNANHMTQPIQRHHLTKTYPCNIQ